MSQCAVPSCRSASRRLRTLRQKQRRRSRSSHPRADEGIETTQALQDLWLRAVQQRGLQPPLGHRVPVVTGRPRLVYDAPTSVSASFEVSQVYRHRPLSASNGHDARRRESDLREIDTQLSTRAGVDPLRLPLWPRPGHRQRLLVAEPRSRRADVLPGVQEDDRGAVWRPTRDSLLRDAGDRGHHAAIGRACKRGGLGRDRQLWGSQFHRLSHHEMWTRTWLQA
jgi:hypothetical protein